MRALLSVYDKTGIVELARELVGLGCELVSSGGTAKVISEAGIAVVDVAEHTGYPAMLGHRVVTLHPKVHGGILADRDDPDHVADLERFEIPVIDLVVANLYPFAADPSVELIDIGGPAMVRAAAKNHAHVGVLVDPCDYASVLDELRADGSLSLGLRRRLARTAFAHTAAYDAQIVAWLDEQLAGDEVDGSHDCAVPPPTVHLSATRAQVLRYGENPHQSGARYTFGDSCWDRAVQHQGKAMSYLNVYDADAAWRLVWSLGDDPAAVVIKHANPCGAAVAADIVTAYSRAHACDPVSAYGGIVALNRPLPVALAEVLVPVFTEVVIAPSFEPGALEVLAAKPNTRVIEARPPVVPPLDVRSIEGGLLVQTRDSVSSDRDLWRVVTDREPTSGEWRDVELAWRIAARVTSNTIVLVKDGQAVGIGAGQQNRRDAGRIAAEKAAGRAVGGACASDAFFPFRDGLDVAIDAGATAVIQPGGSIRDDEVIAAADAAGISMVFTGERHFKH
ncbi:MAG TPA: bifunctional phosphoribosylaminoimidazolecarboxamide formyltransferase/IMP cyclohydrolase [Microthrixaceae bacterium]|nr:bifunctional phosphoribosylaminoimidazolecarboxamide formyltransferase/IMP cyclohydrolase [Microthrixaceae bacterium]HMT22949.1 bifunctional phosphoribosylaminoimidazolecarboxamide formyltransferase/IMP cyclohydrolase [Microthrixaceae bacterium]HMT60137.1 bifunctional phosphoribosylaminoimidazolecarboxamide formyltransferase/IMP cyclohydrolase [Microthrixaceae bacterium]